MSAPRAILLAVALVLAAGDPLGIARHEGGRSIKDAR